MAEPTFVNPILRGDRPDPSILRVEDDYYLVHSSFQYWPGLPLWHSRDLVNWTRVGFALREYDGDVWAPELVHHEGRFFIYYKTTGGNHVVHAESIGGPWSPPVDLKLGWIDPGHVVGPDGRRYLHLSAGMCVELASDGLSTVGEPFVSHEAWPIPRDWRIEGVCLEGPKLRRIGDWYHLLVAQGGTAGPATAHMVVHGRSKSPTGPFEWSPMSPLIHTASREETWHCVGHGSLIDGPDGRWWVVCHGYHRDFTTLGRQALLVPVQWTDDGWLRVSPGADIAGPLQSPAAQHIGSGEIRDDFSAPRLADHWQWFGPVDAQRATTGDGLRLRGAGQTPADSPPLLLTEHDERYRLEATFEACEGDPLAGLCLFYSFDALAGLAVSREGWGMMRPPGARRLRLHEAGGVRAWRLILINDAHEIEYEVLADGRPVLSHRRAIHVAGLHHNTFGGFLSLKPGLFCAGHGSVRITDLRYQRLDP